MNAFLQYTLKLQDQLTGKLNQAATNAGRVFDTMDNRTRPVTRSLNEIQKRMDSLRKTIQFSVNTRDLTKANRELDALEKQANKIQNIGRRSTSGRSIMPSIEMAAVIAGSMALGSQTMAAASGRESMNNVINFTTSGKGASALRQLREHADKFGISMDASLEGFRTLSGSTMSMGLKKQMDIFQGVSAGVSAMGLSAEDAKGTFLALGQIASKGKVSAEELRGQIGERIPGAFEIAARAMGVTTAKLDDMMSKGEIASKDFLPKFAAEMKKTFGDAAQRNVNSSAANFNRYKNAILETKVAIGQQLLPVAVRLLKEYVIPGVKWIGEHANEIMRFVGIVGSVIAVLKVWSTVQMAVNLAIAANPIGAIIMGITAMIAAISALVVWIRKAREEGYSWWYVIKQLNWGLFNAATNNIPLTIHALAVGMKAGAERGWKAVIDAIKDPGKINEVANFMHRMGEIHGDSYKAALLGKLRLVATWFDKFYSFGANGFNRVLDGMVNSSGQTKGFVVKAKRINSTAALIAEAGKDKGAKDSSGKMKNAMDAIHGGGTRNTYISLGKFVEQLIIKPQTLKEGVDEMELMLEQMLLRVLNSSNAITN